MTVSFSLAEAPRSQARNSPEPITLLEQELSWEEVYTEIMPVLIRLCWLVSPIFVILFYLFCFDLLPPSDRWLIAKYLMIPLGFYIVTFRRFLGNVIWLLWNFPHWKKAYQDKRIGVVIMITVCSTALEDSLVALQ